MNVYALENKILYKVNKENITSIDLLNEVEYLTLINKNLKNLQQEFEQTVAQLGQIESQIVAINQQKDSLVEKLKGVYKEENDLAAKLKDTYGDGNIDLASGIFTPSK